MPSLRDSGNTGAIILLQICRPYGTWELIRGAKKIRAIRVICGNLWFGTITRLMKGWITY